MSQEYIAMSNNMREMVNQAISMGYAAKTEITRDYLDQGSTSETILMQKSVYLFASYTPYGVACIEEAFLYRMFYPAEWDSRDLIQRDILTNPHLSLPLKEGLFQAFEKADWAGWYDSYFAKLIRTYEFSEGAPSLDGVKEQVEQNQYLKDSMRENLLLNIKLVNEME